MKTSRRRKKNVVFLLPLPLFSLPPFRMILLPLFLLLILLHPPSSGVISAPQEEPTFADWLPRHSQSEGGLLLLDRRSLAEGEVLLFRTKKSRHRAIAVMSAHQQTGGNTRGHSRFADALTFKEWLRRVYQEDKALKVSVRTTEVVRPVLQHLYATRAHFRAPIIVHANTFEGDAASASSASGHRERLVDAVLFVDSVRSLLPDAVISLGWTQSEDFAAVNRLDWAKAFQLIGLLHSLGDQPVMLNMRLNDAVHSAEVLEWLLGVDRPRIYLVLRGDVDDFVDSESPLRRLANIGGNARRRLLFDVDEKWRSRIRRFAPGAESPTDRLHSVEPSRWLNWQFPSSSSILSTSVISPAGIAFLGWPNSLLLSTRPSVPLPARQIVTGRVMFLPKRQSREVIPQRRSGLVLYLFDMDPALLFAPRVPHAVQAFIGFDGRLTLENNAPTSTLKAHAFAKSSSGQLPRARCYAFALADRGWRVELEVWTERCRRTEEAEEVGRRRMMTMREAEEDEEAEDEQDGRGWTSQRTFLQLDTPIARNRRTRNVAVGKSGDGAIDFLVRALEHNRAPLATIALGPFSLLAIALFALIFSKIF